MIMIIDRIMELAYKIIRPTKMLITSLSFEKKHLEVVVGLWRYACAVGKHKH